MAVWYEHMVAWSQIYGVNQSEWHVDMNKQVECKSYHIVCALRYHVKALFASCPVSLCPTNELFYSSIEQGSDDPKYRRNTLNTLFRPRITSLCHDVCDTFMSRFSALAWTSMLNTKHIWFGMNKDFIEIWREFIPNVPVFTPKYGMIFTHAFPWCRTVYAVRLTPLAVAHEYACLIVRGYKTAETKMIAHLKKMCGRYVVLYANQLPRM